MPSGKKVRVGVVGLGFGAEFVPLYQKHPDAECYAICQRDEAKMKKVGDMFKVERRYTRYEDMLKDKDIDAIHVVTPIAAHAPMTHRRPGGGQARLQHRPHGHHGEGLPAGRRGAQEDRQGLHDDGDRGVHARVPLREGDGGQGRAGQDPVPPRLPPAEHEPARLARLLVRLPAHALRHPRGEPAAGPGQRRGGVGGLLRLRAPSARSTRRSTAPPSPSRPRS